MNLYRIGQEDALRKLGMEGEEGAGAAVAEGGGGDAGDTSGEKKNKPKEKPQSLSGPPPGMMGEGAEPPMPPMEDAGEEEMPPMDAIGAEGGEEELADLPPELMTELGGAEEVPNPIEEQLAQLDPETLQQLLELIQAQDQETMPPEGMPEEGAEPPMPPAMG